MFVGPYSYISHCIPRSPASLRRLKSKVHKVHLFIHEFSDSEMRNEEPLGCVTVVFSVCLFQFFFFYEHWCHNVWEARESGTVMSVTCQSQEEQSVQCRRRPRQQHTTSAARPQNGIESSGATSNAHLLNSSQHKQRKQAHAARLQRSAESGATLLFISAAVKTHAVNNCGRRVCPNL